MGGGQQPPLWRRLLRYFLISAVSIVFTIALVDGVTSRSLQDMELWHTVKLSNDFSQHDPVADFKTYQLREQALFAELRERVIEVYEPAFPDEVNRYIKGNMASPVLYGAQYNHSYELRPPRPKGAVVLLHGLSDSPYSLRHVGQFYFQQGFHVVVPRLPGHGTIPSGLLDVTWEDWEAAAHLAISHAMDELPDGAPLHLVGYSTGAALALNYVADDLFDDDDTRVDRIVLLSPAISVSPFAAFANFHKLISYLPYFAKSRWMEITTEYDPFKYNSFTKNAGWQVRRLTQTLHGKLVRLFDEGKVADFPAVLSFVSVVDNTVSVPSVINVLYDHLPEARHELVLFDFNHDHRDAGLVRPATDTLVKSLWQGINKPWRLTLLSNRRTGEVGVEAFSYLNGEQRVEHIPLSWPAGIFSLSHVALPFPASDPLYGEAWRPGELSLGALRLKGERNVLMIPDGHLMRLRYNPFHAYVERRLGETLEQ